METCGLLSADGPAYQVKFLGEDKGVGVVATRQIRKGEVIFEEKPWVASQFSWNKTYKYAACDLCMRPLETVEENVRRLTNNDSWVLPQLQLCPTDKSSHAACPACDERYCSEACRAQAWNKYHQVICRHRHALDLLNETWKKIHYPPETTSVMLLAKIIAMVEQAEDKLATINTLLEFRHCLTSEDEEIKHKVIGQEFVGKIKMLSELMAAAIPTSSAKELVSEEGLTKLLVLLGRNGQGIGTSVLGEWVNRVNELTLSADQRADLDQLVDHIYDAIEQYVGEFINCEGSGLYCLQRCLNHDCTPTAVVTFPKGDYTLVLEALADLAPGQEITISYLDDCQLARSRHSRAKLLRANYMFTCGCDRCLSQADQPDETSEEEEDEDEDMEDD